MNNYSLIKECPITGHSEQVKYFDLGNIPLVNNLCNTKEEALNAETFPLNINYYPASGESSLSVAVDTSLLFTHYLFKSEVNKPYYEHCQQMFKHAQQYVDVFDGCGVIDIGGNDGSLLEAFRSVSTQKLNLLNIDPSKNLSKLCVDKGIPSLVEFFSFELAKTLEKVSIVTSTNVFQHCPDINSFAKGVECLLNSDGIWILEFPYWIHDMKTNQFDQIYHEHIFYHSITPMKMIMEKHGMKIINISKQTIHGGTLRLTIAKKDSKFVPDATIEKYLELEKNYGLDYHLEWGRTIKHHITNSKKFIEELVLRGNTIYGFGAAAKGCIYLNAMELTDQHIKYIIDDTDIKQGKFVPGVGIEVVGREILKDKQPDFILILAHNFADYIVESLRLEYSGKFIILLPEIKLI